jgi:hypothetical protein
VVDYTALAAVALKLIKQNGHQIIVNKYGVTPADNTKPWRGPVDNHSPLLDTRTLWAVEAGLLPRDVGKTIGKSDIPNDLSNVFLVAPELDTPRLDDYDEVVNGTLVYAISKITLIKPGNTVMLYEIKVEK